CEHMQFVCECSPRHIRGSPQERRCPLMRPLTRWILAHKRFVLVFWLLVTLTGLATSQRATNALSQRFDLPGYESFDTDMAIVRHYGNGGQLAPLVPVITLPAGASV